jgi:flavodoxin
MKTLIICTSVHHGNTRKIAEAMADVMGAEIKEPKDVDPGSIHEYDLIGFGSGIYFGKHHQSLFTLVGNIPPHQKSVFIFSTRGSPFGWRFHEPLKSCLIEKGYTLIGEFSCRGYDTYGPFRWIGGIARGKPDQKDAADASVFARGLISLKAKDEGKQTSDQKAQNKPGI